MHSFVQRLKKKHVQRMTLTRDHHAWIEKRSARLQALAVEFKTCRQTLVAQVQTPQRVQLLWDATELFKEELLEVTECLNEYFKASEKRQQTLDQALEDILRLEASLAATPKTRATKTTPEGVLVTNPFLMHPEDYK